MKVLGIILLIIFGICMIPVGVDFNFEDDKLSLSLKACGKLIRIFPKKKGKTKREKPKEENVKKEKKPDKEKKPKKQKEPKEGGGLSGLHISKDDIFYLIKKVIYKIRRFFRSFNVDRFLLHFISAGKDPYNVARNYAYVNAALSSLAPLCERRFNCKDVDVWTDCDFDEVIPTVDLGFAIVIRIGAFFVLIFGILNSAIAMFVRSRAIFLYQKLFDKDAYLDRLEEEQKLPDLIAKVKRIIASVKGTAKGTDDIDLDSKTKINSSKNERTLNNDG